MPELDHFAIRIPRAVIPLVSASPAYLSYLKISEETLVAELLSIQEVAQITGLHEITIRRYVQAGEPEAVRIGRRIRIRRETLDRLLKPVQSDIAPQATSEEPTYLKEGAAVYEAAGLDQTATSAQAIIGGVAVRMGQLPMEDIRPVTQIAPRLQQSASPDALSLSRTIV